MEASTFQPSGPGRALLPLQGPFQPPALYLLEADSATLQPLLVPKLPDFDPAAFEVKATEQEVAIAPRGKAADAPVLLESYGAFGETLAPTYDPLRLEWLRLGGRIRLAQLVAAPRQQEQTVDRLLAIAGSEGRVVYRGQSFGATLGLMAMRKKPSAFDAVLADAPLTDLLHFADRRPGELWVPELGDAKQPEELARLRHLSPLHNIAAGPLPPPTILTVARHDATVDWRHAALYAQLALERGEKVWFRCQEIGTHDRLRPLGKEQAQLACLLWQLSRGASL
jgi:prolyl oligopeptidase PreP (S9A serine peptidase family)